MAEKLEESQTLESTTVGVFRTATVVKGGRRFGFAALVVVGDRSGSVGIGYGKGRGVPVAIEKAQKDARKNLFKIPMDRGTLPHSVDGSFGSSKVRLLPAAPGTGVVAGGTVRAVLEMVGIKDCMTKAYGSTNKKNLCKAVLVGLNSLRTREQQQKLRNMDIGPTDVEVMLEKSQQNFDQATGEDITQDHNTKEDDASDENKSESASATAEQA